MCVLILLAKIIATSAEVTFIKWWFSKEILPKCPQKIRFGNSTNLSRFFPINCRFSLFKVLLKSYLMNPSKELAAISFSKDDFSRNMTKLFLSPSSCHEFLKESSILPHQKTVRPYPTFHGKFGK